MNKKVVVATLMALAASASIASAAPQTTWNQGEWQLDLGAWAPKAKTYGLDSDTKWNFNGGLGYAISNKWALRYDYHGLKTEAGDFETDGDEHEVNLLYSLGKNVALFAGWNRIDNDFDQYGSVTNNVAQFGVATKFDLAKNLSLYADGALGTKSTSLWEAGLSYTINKDWDINAGYRYVDTEVNDDHNIKYRGFLVGLSYRFGGHKAEAAPVVEEPAPVEEPVVEEHVYNDYYLDSIHFASDADQPLDSEKGKMDRLVEVAKDHPDSTFKLVGNTDSDASDEYNDDLSKRRVDNVAKYVTDNGVSSDRLKLNYKGEKDPAASNATEQGKADNRRVDVWEHK
ncbi:MAG: OmpA-like domain-containing protein [Succiniclasticum sp.]|jgi:OmpA-OmpF porin, OOP family